MKLVKGLIKIFLVLGIIVVILWGVNKVFFDCKEINVPFEQEFTLKKYDYAKIDNEVVVKLMKIQDFRCKKADCDGGGEFEYKVLVINDHKYAYVTLGSVATKKRDIEKLGYTLSIENVEDDDSVTFKLVRMEKKVKY